MGLIASIVNQEDEEKTLQLNATEFFSTQKKIKNTFLPAEWNPQSGIQLTWPHANTDWNYMLQEVKTCYHQLAQEIARRELLLIVTPEPAEVQKELTNFFGTEAEKLFKNIRFFECPTNDTWARDHGFITVMDEKGPILKDFTFNGWGLKYAANLDNQICRRMTKAGIVKGTYRNCLDFVLEGGSIESDGCGTLLTTAECLLSPNRNETLSRAEIETRLEREFNIRKVLWLEHGFLRGDDTDSHVDTLARLCPMDTIVYVQCTDQQDEHYEELQLMEKELRSFRNAEDMAYRLLPLPMADCILEEGERIPATYANFLILNKAVLYPTYAQPENDARAKAVLQQAFPTYEIVGIDCRALIKQHGSLHCVTMQFPADVLY